MDKVNEVFSLLKNNSLPGKSSSDIMEHLETLYLYSRECNSVFETGVRGCVSSWAFLKGLMENNSSGNRLFLNDVTVCDIYDLLKAGANSNVEIRYEWKNNLLLEFNEKFDITFIDTWHVYGQLKRELEKFSKITNKYIIMHDTTVDELYGETIRCHMDAYKQSQESGIPIEEINKGLWPAVEEFVNNNPEWYIKERYTNNHGLTILARR